MAIHYGEDFELYVRTATGPDVWTPVEDLNRFGKRSSRNSASFPAFRRATAYTIPGARESTYSAAGYLNSTDTGQNFLRTAEAAGTNVFIRVVFTAGSGQGFEQEVRVGSTSYDTTPEGIQEIGLEFTAVGDATAYGTPGVIL
jgi:hypothetical protein